jgi:hypothetical protein
MNVLNTPNSEFKPSGEHAPSAVDVRREEVQSILASMAHKVERPIQPSPEVAAIIDTTNAQQNLRRIALRKSDYGKAA